MSWATTPATSKSVIVTMANGLPAIASCPLLTVTFICSSASKAFRIPGGCKYHKQRAQASQRGGLNRKRRCRRLKPATSPTSLLYAGLGDDARETICYSFTTETASGHSFHSVHDDCRRSAGSLRHSREGIHRGKPAGFDSHHRIDRYCHSRR